MRVRDITSTVAKPRTLGRQKEIGGLHTTDFSIRLQSNVLRGVLNCRLKGRTQSAVSSCCSPDHVPCCVPDQKSPVHGSSPRTARRFWRESKCRRSGEIPARSEESHSPRRRDSY